MSARAMVGEGPRKSTTFVEPLDGPATKNPRPSGEELVAELQGAADRACVTLARFAEPLAGPNIRSWLSQLRTAGRPLPSTVERVRALVAGEPLPATRRSAEFWADRPARRRGDESLSARPANQPWRVPCRDTEATRAQCERNLALAERARAERRGGETLGDALRRIGREVAAEERLEADERRERELIELPTPASLIRRAQRDWPEQCERVAALAAEMGVAKGEAWARVIAAGIEGLMGESQ